MKKSLIISIGVVLAIIIGALFYSLSIPKNTSAALGVTTADNAGGPNRCRYINENGGVSYSACCTTQEYGPNCRTWCQQTSSGDFLAGGQCSVDGLTGSTTGSGLTYFTEAQASAFMQGGGTDTQVSAINGIYAACQALIASKPTVLPVAQAADWVDKDALPKEKDAAVSDGVSVEFDSKASLNCRGYWGCENNVAKCLLSSDQVASGCVRAGCYDPSEPPPGTCSGILPR